MLEAWKKNSGMRELSAFMEDDSGVGVIEVVLIRFDWSRDHFQDADHQAPGKHL